MCYETMTLEKKTETHTVKAGKLMDGPYKMEYFKFLQIVIGTRGQPTGRKKGRLKQKEEIYRYDCNDIFCTAVNM